MKLFRIAAMSLAAAAAFSVTSAVSAQQSAAPAPSNQGGQTARPANSNGAPDSRPKRVHAQIAGFDLAPQSVSPNQIGGASRGESGKAAVLLAPHKAKVYSLHPTFAWAGSSSSGYTFELIDMATQSVYKTDVSGNAFVYPEDAPPLEPGKTYSWRVATGAQGDPSFSQSAPALIVVLGGPAREREDSALGASSSTSPDADADKAKMLFDDRLWYDAVAAYSQLIATHPDNAEFHRMRAMLYDQVPAAARQADTDYAQAR